MSHAQVINNDVGDIYILETYLHSNKQVLWDRLLYHCNIDKICTSLLLKDGLYIYIKNIYHILLYNINEISI